MSDPDRSALDRLRALTRYLPDAWGQLSHELYEQAMRHPDPTYRNRVLKHSVVRWTDIEAALAVVHAPQPEQEPKP